MGKSAAVPIGSECEQLEMSRQRKLHTKSRQGCYHCKQLHVRCDERKPTCTKCLVHGIQCNYPKKPSQLKADLRPLLKMRPSNPVDPFDALPVKMPLRSYEIYQHFIHYRQLSETPSSNQSCVSMLMQNTATFRCALLLASMHYYWLNNSFNNIEETYLYHHVETLRSVNMMIANLTGSDDDNLTLSISALATSETALGRSTASEAHTKALFALMDRPQCDELHDRAVLVLQRMSLISGSLLAIARTLSGRDGLTSTALNKIILNYTTGVAKNDVSLSSSTPSSSLKTQLPPQSPSKNVHLSCYSRAEFSLRSNMSPPNLFSGPNPSGIWATASYLYMHLMLPFLWAPHTAVDPHLLYWLHNVFRADLWGAKRESMKAAGHAYYNEILTWKIAVTAYALKMALAWGEEGGWGISPATLTDMSLDNHTKDKTSFRNAQEVAAELRMWFGTLLAQWKKGANITCLDTARQVLDMMRLMETSARGELVLEMWKHATTISTFKST